MLSFFFFNDTATTEIYTLSLHDALPIFRRRAALHGARSAALRADQDPPDDRDRKSTRLNSSHSQISYAVFCLKNKRKPAPSVSEAWRSVTSIPCSALLSTSP